MPWFKVDDKLHDHRKSRRAQKAAMGVWVLAGSWCMDNLSDGFVPESVLSRWGTRRDAAKLVDALLWETAEKDGENGWQFCNWHAFQPSKAEIESEREATKERVRKWREGKKGNAVTNGVTNGDVTPEVRAPRPDPTRPDPSKDSGARKRATSLPDDFRPSDKHQALAAELGVNLRGEWVKFCDHHRAKGSVFKDWGAALNNWIRRSAEYGGNVRPLRAEADDQGRIVLPPLPKGVFEQ